LQTTQNFSQNNNFIYSVTTKQIKLSDSKQEQEFKNDSLNINRVSELTNCAENDLKQQLGLNIKIYQQYKTK